MRTKIEAIPHQDSGGSVRVLLVEPETSAPKAPVLLFLHGKGEASPFLNELPKVCFHLSPPFQAIVGRLRNVIVVAPQAPRSPNDGWSWDSYTESLGAFLGWRFRDHLMLATGFSRGGLGVLQLIRDFPGLVARWAIVDPQRPRDEAEEQGIVPQSPCLEGWLRYGGEIPKNKAFAERLSARLDPESSQWIARRHAELALAAYSGDRLQGPRNLYEFLGVPYG